jgi:hypothetical protein
MKKGMIEMRENERKKSRTERIEYMNILNEDP